MIEGEIMLSVQDIGYHNTRGFRITILNHRDQLPETFSLKLELDISAKVSHT